MKPCLVGAAAFTFGLTFAITASATTYEVGAGKPYATVQDTLAKLAPGDTVEVQGDATYPGDLWLRTSGTKDKPITIVGIQKSGHRPTIKGVGTAQYHNIIVLLNANYLVFEGFEIVGDKNPANFGVVHKGDHVTVSDVVVHDVAGQGLLGTDAESGSLTLEKSEFYGNGSGTYNHQIYMATDETMYPGSVFRMQYCYVHDGVGGNNVKSRAERNEIYYNWIEGAFYHELDLIGPDGQDPSLAREDSDVVGNVLIKTSEWRIARIGGDGTGDTDGRYRFVNNTMILSAKSPTAIGLQDQVQSLEMHNNVIVRVGAAGGAVWDHNDPNGPEAQFFGSHNFIQTGFSAIPASFTATVSGKDPGFSDGAKYDYRPKKGAPIVDGGTANTSISSPAFVNPLLLPAMVPPARKLGTQAVRVALATPDIGAFEFGSGTAPGDGGVPTSGSGGGHVSGSSSGGSGGSSSKSGSDSGCGCRVAGEESPRGLAFVAIAAALSFGRRRLGVKALK